jgi:hypothetical protein
MIHYLVGFRYIKSNRVAERSSVWVLADSEAEAAEAFMATHPAGSNFRYEVAYTTHPDA